MSKILSRIRWRWWKARIFIARLICPKGYGAYPDYAYEFYLREGIGKTFTRFAEAHLSRVPADNFYKGKPLLDLIGPSEGAVVTDDFEDDDDDGIPQREVT